MNLSVEEPNPIWLRIQLPLQSIEQPPMSDKNFPDVIKEIHHKDDRFAKGAYYFIREALDHTLKSMESNRGKNKGHVSGRELLDGIKDYALERFGPMTLTLMNLSLIHIYEPTRLRRI